MLIYLRRLVPYIIALLLCAGCDTTPTPTATPAAVGANAKIGSQLLNVYIVYRDKGKEAALTYAHDIGLLDSKNEVVYELRLAKADDAQVVAAKVVAMGGRVLLTQGALMDVAVPADIFIQYANDANARANFVQELAGLPQTADIHIIVRGVAQTTLPETHAGLVALAESQNEGLRVIGADAWQAVGFRGVRVRIGIIDRGYRYHTDFRGLTLPADFAPKDFGTGDPLLDSTAHGTAVAEILHSIAPDATLVAAAASSETEFAQAAQYLLDQRVSIIATSLGFPGGSGDGNPDTSLADATAATIADVGVLLVTAAGNTGVSHYAGVFDPDKEGFHQFAPGVTRIGFGYLHDHGAPTTQIVSLNWRAWTAYLAHQNVPDLDLFIEDANGTPVASSQDGQSAHPPREYLQMKMTMGVAYYARIRLKPGTPPPAQPLVLDFETTNGAPLQYVVARGSTTLAPADSPAALTIGAADWNTSAIAYYSSQGPTADGRLKPELVAPTGVSNRAMARDGDATFNGTSAAAPQVAGAAALLKGANASLTAAQMRDILYRRAHDIGQTGVDTVSGYGLVALGTPGDAQPVAKVAAPPLDTALPPAPSLNPDFAGMQSSTTTPAQPLNGLRLSDDFGGYSGLPDVKDTYYQGGAYHIDVATPDQLLWSVYRDSAADFEANVDIQPQPSVRGGMFGFVFWFSDPRNYYAVLVTDEDQPRVGIVRFVGGQWQQVVDWASASGQAAITRLQVHGSRDGTLTLSVNGALNVHGTTDPNQSGAYGFAAGITGATGSYRVVFQNFRLRSSVTS